MILIHFSLYRDKDPNMDASSLPLLEYICAHPNLDVSSLPLLEYICAHPNLDVPSLPLLEKNLHIQIWMFLVFH